MSSIKIDHVMRLVAERDLSHITAAWFDINGRLRAKHLHTDRLEKAMTTGTAINLGVFSLGPDETQMPGNRFLDPANQFRDGRLWLDPGSYRDFPLDAGGRGILLIGNLVDEQRVYCPRALLAEELERFTATATLPSGSFEYECYMLDETMESIRNKTPAQVQAWPGFEKMYDFVQQVHQNPLLQELIDVCEHMEIPLDTVHTEFSGLLETALKPRAGMNMADNAALFKALCKAVSLNHGILASFMARRNTTEQACGAHINLSLWHPAEDRTLCYDEKAQNRIGIELLHFVGGLQKYTPELFLLHCPNLNSYRRLQPDLFAPLSNTWGIDNKTVAYRVVNSSPEVARVEIRLPGADINPYLALAAVLIAGRRGLEDKCSPTAPVEGDGWSVAHPEGMEYPVDFSAAIEKFRLSELARETLGNAFVNEYVSSRLWQTEALAATVTDWELRTFLADA